MFKFLHSCLAVGRIAASDWSHFSSLIFSELRIVASLSNMSAKKCCCCGLLSCFPCFSDKKSTLPAQHDSSEIAPPPLTVISNPSPAETLSSAPCHQLSSSASPSATAPSQVNASPVMQNDSQPTAPSDAVPSSSPGMVTPSALIPTASLTTASPPAQPASSSTPSSSALIPTASLTTASPPAQPASSSTPSSSALIPTASLTTASPPAQPASSSTPSSSALIPTASLTTASPPAQPASSSTPSSGVLKKSDYAEAIKKAAEELDKENVDNDFSALINYISQLLDFVEEKKKGKNPSMLKAAVGSFPGSKSLFRLKDVVSEGVNAVKDIVKTDRKTFLMGFLKGMGMAHMVTTGFLLVASILERHEAISANKEACLYLLKEMNILAQYVQQLQQRPELKKSMEAGIREATTLIVEASIDCCTQIGASKSSSFFSATVNGEALAKFQKRLADTRIHLQDGMGLCQFDGINKIDMRLRKGQELKYPEYPKDAVGIEDPVREVIERLEMGSDKKAVAVIVHGFGGMGKTTLADAVFARLFDANREGYKYSCVRLFDTIASTPNIVELQKFIIKALKMGEEPEFEFQRYEEGQVQIKSILEREVVFIYIDNVLLRDEVQQRGDALEQLLPKNMGNANKLRLLITARNKDAEDIIVRKEVKTECYAIQSLPEAAGAAELFKNTLSDKLKQLDPSQIDELVKICGGVPKLLTVVARFIRYEKDTLKAYRTVVKESKTNWKGKIGEDINFYVFAYENLDQTLQDPFLDICSFFEGWDWKTLSNIVGDSKLEKLDKRGLVTKDAKGMTAKVHDIILAIGLQKSEGQRFRFTCENDLQKFLANNDEVLRMTKGIWASDSKDPLRIPASKLDLMSGSLRVLKLGHLTDVEGKCKNTFKELVFFSDVTSRLLFDLSKLKEFKSLRHLCYNPEDLQNLLQMPSSLRHIKFQLNSVPFRISSTCIKQLSKLRVLTLANARFKSLPQELGDLGNSLEELSFTGCQNLKELPASISRLGYLRVLRMDDCSGLTELPKGLGSLKNCLQELYLYGCKSLKTLPSELENLTSLQKLDLSYCESLKELPRSLGNLTSLQELHLYMCQSLGGLPPSLEELSSLRLLDLSWCTNIKELPYGLGKLTSLVELQLSCCGLSSIPENIGMLKLNSIRLCSASLKDLPDGFCNFSTLTELDMTNCVVKELPERFGKVTSLRKLKLSWCHSLQKLPESFNQLKYLEHLDLSRCSTLEELCKEFEGLSRLRVLSLENCGNLKKLPEDFQCLTSLEVLDVRNCSKLEGKWIDSMLKMEKLQILRIAGSKLLEERWEKTQAQQCNQSWSCAVYTEQGLSNEENLLKQFQSEFDSMLTHGEREPLNISGLPLHTLLLVMFDGQQEFRPHFPLPLLEESIDDIETHFAMVYFGNHFKKLPEKVADRILGHAPANGHGKALFQKLVPLVTISWNDLDCLLTSSFQMTAEIVSGEKGDKYLSRWKFSGIMPGEKKMLEDFVVTKCGRYVKLKQLAERPGGSPIALLTELFPRGEEEISLSFLKNKDGEFTKVGVDELKGKTILLDIRPANICFDIPLHALVEMYNVEKEKFGFEIITIPLIQENTKSDVSVEFSREVPWLVLQNPWQLTNATKYFLVDNWRPQWNQEWDRWYPNPMRIIKSDGTIAPYKNPGVLHMVNTWGAAAYPFTAEKEEELIQKEKTQMELMSDGMFLFQHLERVAEQLREATGQQKMIWLCCCHEKEFTNSMKDVLTELSDIIYIIYIPYFHKGGGVKFGHFTATIYESYYVEPSKMSSAEMGRIFSLSLSEYEAIRFWARIYSLKEIISEMLSRATDGNSSWMFIMDEDGNLITTKGKEIVKLLSEKYSDDRVKEVMQQLIKGTKNSWKETLSKLQKMSHKLQKMSHIDSEDSEGDLEEFYIEDSEGDLEEFYIEDSEVDLEESDDVESQGNLSEELCSDDADRDCDDGDREGDDVFQEN